MPYFRIFSYHFSELYDFYTSNLGLSVVYGSLSNPYVTFAFESIHFTLHNNQYLTDSLGIDSSYTNSRFGSNSIFIIPFSDVEKKFNELRHRGVIFISSPAFHEELQAITAHFIDPDGNIFELHKDLTQ